MSAVQETPPDVDDVAAAEQEAEAAEAQVTALEAAVVAGDPSVTADAIEGQRGLARFYRLRVQAAQRRREAMAEENRQAAVVSLMSEVEQFGSDEELDPLRELYAAAVSSTQELRSRLQAREARYGELLGRARELQAPGLRASGIYGDVFTLPGLRPLPAASMVQALLREAETGQVAVHALHTSEHAEAARKDAQRRAEAFEADQLARRAQFEARDRQRSEEGSRRLPPPVHAHSGFRELATTDYTADGVPA
jgi:hypothetical protein